MSNFDTAVRQVGQVAAMLYAQSSAVRSVGVSKIGGEYGYEVVKNSTVIEPFAAEPQALLGAPLQFKKTNMDVVSAALRVPYTLFTTGSTTSFIPEQSRIRPLVDGLQIQNYDADIRNGVIAQGLVTIGTLGCYVKTKEGQLALLSNNHVVASENDGKQGDQIVQESAATAATATANLIARLADFINITPSPAGAKAGSPSLVYNHVDAGTATLVDGMKAFQHYMRPGLPQINGTDDPLPEQEVFKVGRTTGLTRGIITSVATIVGPVGYTHGPSWFQGSFVIEGINDTLFSDKGDSGSAIVSKDGKLLGLLYAGNGTQTYACPIADVFRLLQCSL